MDPEALKEIIKNVIDEYLKHSGNNTVLYYLLGISIAVNFIAVIANLAMQLKLKNKDVDIHLKKTKLDKSRIVYENIFSKFQEISNLDTRIDKDKFQSCIEEIDKLINGNRLYIDSNALDWFSKYSDYYKNVFFDYSKKSYEKEENFTNKLIEIFNL